MNNQYKCQDCQLVYTLSEARIKQDSPQHGNFICDICEGESNE